ncbi:MAG: TonB-dependent receptor [Flavobacterium sp.]|nr:TonB-dependent receptor [Flavobacterium sp.]
MSTLRSLFALILLVCFSFNSFAQPPQGARVKVTGTVIEKTSKQPLEYATVTFVRPGQTTAVSGGITDATGSFSIDVPTGNYDINIEFISFKLVQLQNRTITGDISLGTIQLSEDINQLDEVVIRAERTTVDIRLDKKVYSVGADLMVKGGTVSDVLDNIPSVAVDAEGTISLRGNENVRILIDGRPSNAINISEALRLIPADAIEKVEVVTNPSARYDSEGGGGLLNIILKKGKNLGLNGTFIASVGDPETYGVSANLNYKTEDFNLFTTTGYNYRTGPGNSITNTEYLLPDGSPRSYTNERRENDRLNRGLNTNFGMEWYLDDSTTWTNQVRIRKNRGDNPDNVIIDNFDADRNFLFTNRRFNNQKSDDEEVEYSTNLVKKFKKDGHTLTVDASFELENDYDYSDINFGLEKTDNKQKQTSNQFQVDYVLPLGKDSQFEAGYSGDFNDLLTDYKVDFLDTETNQYISDQRYTNMLEYKEKINALYTQYGTKFNKFSVLLGLRWEDSNIEINQLTTNDFNNKKYNNFFPSAFFTYELSGESSVSLSYSRRISRPRGRQINPFSNYSSNINLFQGNPDLDPAFSNAFDLGYLLRMRDFTFSTSMYLNHTTDSFQYIRRESGDFASVIENGTEALIPIIITTPINLATEYRFGFEFTTNYNPFKWWRLNSNFNLFRNETQGDYSYVNSQNEEITQNFDNIAFSWFARLTSKVTLPYNIEWQTNFTYNAPQTTAQGKVRGIAAANLAFSKDVLKDQGTLTLNVQDVFNSRKRIYETNLPELNSYSEMQWRVRSVNLSFTYRFNRKKSERDRQPQRENMGDEEFQG